MKKYVISNIIRNCTYLYLYQCVITSFSLPRKNSCFSSSGKNEQRVVAIFTKKAREMLIRVRNERFCFANTPFAPHAFSQTKSTCMSIIGLFMRQMSSFKLGPVEIFSLENIPAAGDEPTENKRCYFVAIIEIFTLSINT